MMRYFKVGSGIFGLVALGACSSTGSDTSTPSAPAPRAVPASYTMEVTDIDYGSLQTDQRYLISYSFPNASGRFAVQSTSQAGISEPVSDTSDYASVNDDVAGSIVCKEGLRKLNSTPDYLVADRAYQSVYVCNNPEG